MRLLILLLGLLLVPARADRYAFFPLSAGGYGVHLARGSPAQQATMVAGAFADPVALVDVPPSGRTLLVGVRVLGTFPVVPAGAMPKGLQGRIALGPNSPLFVTGQPEWVIGRAGVRDDARGVAWLPTPRLYGGPSLARVAGTAYGTPVLFDVDPATLKHTLPWDVYLLAVAAGRFCVTLAPAVVAHAAGDVCYALDHVASGGATVVLGAPLFEHYELAIAPDKAAFLRYAPPADATAPAVLALAVLIGVYIETRFKAPFTQNTRRDRGSLVAICVGKIAVVALLTLYPAGVAAHFERGDVLRWLLLALSWAHGLLAAPLTIAASGLVGRGGASGEVAHFFAAQQALFGVLALAAAFYDVPESSYAWAAASIFAAIAYFQIRARLDTRLVFIALGIPAVAAWCVVVLPFWVEGALHPAYFDAGALYAGAVVLVLFSVYYFR